MMLCLSGDDMFAEFDIILTILKDLEWRRTHALYGQLNTLPYMVTVTQTE